MLTSKADWERQIFIEFAAVAGLAIDQNSVASAEPPAPDIRFTVQGREHYAELVEITDKRLAQRVMISIKRNEISGGFYSQNEPLARAFENKSDKRYCTSGSPLILLAYYDKQEAADEVELDLIPREVSGISAAMVASGVWQRIWVYTRWRKQVLWVYPALSGATPVRM